MQLATPTVHDSPRFGPLTLLRRSWAQSWPLTLVGLLMVPTLLAALVGLLIDPRVITGAPAWLKPAKFAVSIAIYAFTFTWMLGYVQGRLRRWARAAAAVTALAFAVEMVIIGGQVLRGTTSHFNIATPLDAALFSMMGGFIVVLWVMGLLLAALLLIQRLPEPAFAWGLRLGLLITLVGAGVGFLMTTPTAEQQASWAGGAPPTIAGAHSVGAPDGRPGLPVLGWSTSSGDLRVGHFIGLHAMQVVPMIGWLVGRTRLSARRRTALVWALGGGYLGLVLLATWQALRAQPLTDPDSLTLGALAALAAAVALATGATLLGRAADAPRQAD